MLNPISGFTEQVKFDINSRGYLYIEVEGEEIALSPGVHHLFAATLTNYLDRLASEGYKIPESAKATYLIGLMEVAEEMGNAYQLSRLRERLGDFAKPTDNTAEKAEAKAEADGYPTPEVFREKPNYTIAVGGVEITPAAILKALSAQRYAFKLWRGTEGFCALMSMADGTPVYLTVEMKSTIREIIAELMKVVPAAITIEL